MSVKGCTETLIDGLGNLALDLSESRLLDGSFVHIVGTNSGCPYVRLIVQLSQVEGIHTLVIMVLLVVVAIKLAKNLDDIGVGVGTTEGVAGAIKTKNEFDVFTRNNRLLDMRAVS